MQEHRFGGGTGRLGSRLLQDLRAAGGAFAQAGVQGVEVGKHGWHGRAKLVRGRGGSAIADSACRHEEGGDAHAPGRPCPAFLLMLYLYLLGVHAHNSPINCQAKIAGARSGLIPSTPAPSHRKESPACHASQPRAGIPPPPWPMPLPLPIRQGRPPRCRARPGPISCRPRTWCRCAAPSCPSSSSG
ncbi:hypothetical protein D3C72_1811520 [compost metagenome]